MKPVALVLSLSLLCLLSLPATPARATTFQMVSDSTLTDQARAVVDARVVDVEPSTPDEFTQRMTTALARWKTIIDSIGYKAQ